VRFLPGFLFLIFTLLFSAPSIAVPQIEGRFIELQNTYNKAEWTTISFSQVYDEPPAVFMLSTNQGDNPAIVKIRNVTRTGFEALPLEPSGEDGPHITMGAHYLAIAYGKHNFPDGSVVEVGKVELDGQYIQASPSSDWPRNGEDRTRYFPIDFEHEFAERPVFFHSIQTVNNQVKVRGQTPPNTYLLPFLTISAKWDFVNSDTSLIYPPATSEQTYFIAFEASETEYEPITRTETIAYMATTEGDGRTFFDDSGQEVLWEAFFADNQIIGWDDGCVLNSFRNTYTQTPLVAASKVSRNGSDGGWLRSCGLNRTRLGLRVDEDRSRDNERNHTQEDASIIAMTSEFVFSGDLPRCDVAFPGALATFADSQIFLTARTRVIDDNNGKLTTFQYTTNATGQGANIPRCGSPGVPCFASNTNALSEGQARAIPSVTLSDSGPTTLPSQLAGDYFFRRDSVLMTGAYTVVAPTRIYIDDVDGGVTTLLSIVNANIALSTGAYLSIYVDGDVLISNSNPNAIVLAEGEINFTNIENVSLVGRFTAGGGINVNGTSQGNSSGTITATAIPNSIPGICGQEVIEVLNHYRFELADNRGSSCAAKPVTLKACADIDCTVLYSQPAKVNLLPLSNSQYQWTPSQSVTFTGQASLTIDSLDGSDPTLATSGEIPSSQLRCFVGGNEVALAKCRVDFRNDGLVFKNVTDNTNTILTQLSGKPSDTGYNSKNYVIEACTNGNALRNKTLDVELNYVCGSQSICSNTLAFEHNSATYNIGTAPTTYPVTFDSSSRAAFSFQYPDAGELALRAKVVPRAGVEGSSNNFVVRPFGFQLSVLNDDRVTTNGNAFATTASDSLLTLAGEPFPLAVRPVQWVSGEDNNNDGTPDNFVSLANNITAKHFSGNVALTASSQLPTGGVTGNFVTPTNGAAFSGQDTSIVDVSYDEVGIISIAAQSNFLSAGLVQGALANVGRFAPANFQLTGNVTSACSLAGRRFTYFEQPLSEVAFTLQAQNTKGEATVNYRQGFDALTDIVVTAANGATLLNRLENIDSFGWPQTGTTGQIVFADNNVTFGRLPSAQLDTAYPNVSVGLSANGTQLEGATINSSVCAGNCYTLIDTGLMFAQGRATLTSNYGNIDEALLLPFKAQYFDGSDWRLNTFDSCTLFNSSSVIDGSNSLSLNNSGRLIEGQYGAGEGIRASSPTGEGQFPVSYAPPAWLLWDWDGDNVVDNGPAATLTYGAFRGNDNIIYRREDISN